MNIYDCFAFTGAKFQLIKGDTIGFMAGNSICKWNLEKNSKKYIVSEKNGFQCFAVNHRRKILVTAEYGLSPLVRVYVGQEQFDLQNVSPLEILQMEVSSCGRYLLVVVGVPKFEICIWDLSEKKRLRGTQSQLPLRLNFIEAKFMTLGDRIILHYEKHIQLYKIVPYFENEGQNVIKNIRLELVATYDLHKPTKMVLDYNFILDSRNSYEENNLYLVQGNRIIFLDGKNLEEVSRHECHSPPKHMIITQVHLIVVYSQSKFEWLYKYIATNLKDQATFPFKLHKKYNHPDRGEISFLTYNHAFTKLICSTEDASLIILPIQAESSQGEDEGAQEAHEVDKVIDLTHEIEFVKLGPFQRGAIAFIREFKEQFVSICGCESGKIVFWDIVQRTAISSFKTKGRISSGDLCQNILVVGSFSGVVRFYNVADIRNPVLFKMVKLFIDKPVSCVCFSEQSLAISSVESPHVFFFQGDQMLGFVELPFNCQAICWSQTAPLLLCISSFLLLSVSAPKAAQQTLRLELQVMGRKIDPDQLLIVASPSGDVITTGKDKIFKKYKLPEEVLSKMDLKMRVANQAPIDEQDGHSLPANCLAIKEFLYSGAKDGSIMIRSAEKLGQDVRVLKAHNLKSGGVSAIYQSPKLKLLYTGGFDGELFWWLGEKIKVESDAASLMKNNFSAPPDIGDVGDEEVKYYQQVLELELLEQQAPMREGQKKQIKDNLKQIQNKLLQLIAENNQAEELEKLERDEFVIDLVAKEAILEDGKKQKQALREQVRKENVRWEILYNLIKERTWDQMEVPLKGINGLSSNILVTNFHVRVRTNDELRKLKIIRELRKQEIKELKLRKANNIKEVWSLDEQIQDPKYIINGKPGHPQLVLADYEKKEDPQPLQKVVNKPGERAPVGKQPAQGGRAAALANKNRQQQQQQQQLEEEKKKEEEERERQQQLEKEKQAKQTEEKKDGDEMTEWDYLYGVQELFTNNRKRNQMVLLSDIIFSIKKQFNLEFEALMKQRHNQLDNINERNKRIGEINIELKRENLLVECKRNIMEDPERVLQVKKDEIPFEQYETREMREKKEQERLKEEARLRALMSDDSGIRAVKDMMGGTLEEKKETPLDEKLEMEEWMKKNPDDMTEDERMKLKEFEVRKARLEEEKEKIRKNLEAELKKLNSEIVEICNRFDDKVLILFRRKLEYDYRILEQELNIVRLALSIIIQQQAQGKVNELEKLQDGLIAKLQLLRDMKQSLDAMKDQTFNQRKVLQEQLNNYFTAQRLQFPQGFNANNVKQLWQNTFEDYKSNDKLKQESDARLLANPKFKNILIALDPYFENQKALVYRQLEEQFDSFVPSLTERLSNSVQENLEQAIEFFKQVFGQRFKVKLEFERADREYQDLEVFCKGFELDLSASEGQQQSAEEDLVGLRAMLERSKSNIEVMFRFKQGFVEISQDKPVPNLAEAILIPRALIDSKNQEIMRQGDKKLGLLEEIKKIKFDVAKSKYEQKRRNLIIQDLQCKTREVQLLKVKKEMQVALTKDDTRLNEKELSNLKEQMEMLQKTTIRRLETINRKKEKIEKDIDFIRKENSQLLGQGSVLQGNVKQLQEISDMQNKKNVKQGEEVQEVTETKFMQIARNHKLFHVAKKQAEEIELLRDELQKLKARTFANFTHANR